MITQAEMEHVLDMIAKGYVVYDAELRYWRYKGKYVSVYACPSWQELVEKMKQHNVWPEESP